MLRSSPGMIILMKIIIKIHFYTVILGDYKHDKFS